MPVASRAAAALTGGVLAATSFGVAHADAATARTPARSGPTDITAKAGLLYDVGANKMLWTRATGTERPIGSITKVMTALIVIRDGHLDRTITIKKKWVDYVKGNDLSSADLKTGDRLTVRQLLSGMMLPSGCDAAFALADSYPGGATKFIAKMNATAKSLGLKHTHYLMFDGNKAPTGKEGYSTPDDVLRLAVIAMRNSTFRAVVGQNTYNVSSAPGRHAYHWLNTNKLLDTGGVYGYPGAFGIKTGTTDGAGYCLLFAAKRGGRTLYGVVLNTTPKDYYGRFHEAARILDWGFGKARTRLLIAPMRAGEQFD